MPQPLSCPGCGTATPAPVLAEAPHYPFWERPDGACPACVQARLLTVLLERGEALFHGAVQSAWPLDAEAAFGVLPTPLRLHADPRFAGRGVCIAMVDSAFAPHPDLVRPSNRIRAWVDATTDPPVHLRFDPGTAPSWPGAHEARDGQWHGTMTATAAAGNGWLSHGLYRGLAAEAALVLIQTRDDGGRITDASILRALGWIERHGAAHDVRVVNLSVAGARRARPGPSPIDEAIDRLVARGITVVAASGNDGIRSLVPPATAPAALTVGGIDDEGGVGGEPAARLWHANYGDSSLGLPKPELVAPSLWVAAPVLPGSTVAREAEELFARRRQGSAEARARIEELKLITPHYQHVEGTSFAAPVVAAAAACMLEANPGLTPSLVRDLLIRTAEVVRDAPPDRQGAGVVHCGRAVLAALLERHGWDGPLPITPVATAGGVIFRLHDHSATEVRVLGSWNDWSAPVALPQVEAGLFESPPLGLGPGEYAYKFRIDDEGWLADPGNPWRAPDGTGGVNSTFRWPLR